MTMQLSLIEVQDAVADYLRKRGAVVEHDKVQLEIVDRTGARMNIVGCSAVVIAYEVELA